MKKPAIACDYSGDIHWPFLGSVDSGYYPFGHNDGKAYVAALPSDAMFVDETLTIGDKVFPALQASNGVRLIPYCLGGSREPGDGLQRWFRLRNSDLISTRIGLTPICSLSRFYGKNDFCWFSNILLDAEII